MAATDSTPNSRVFLEVIEDAERRIGEHATFAKKLKTRLAKTKRALAAKPAIAAEVSKLVSDLRSLGDGPEGASPSQLRNHLEERLNRLETNRRSSFPNDLKRACDAKDLEFVPLADGFGVGPFLFTPAWQKESGAFQYAKLEVAAGVSLDVHQIAERAIALRQEIIDAPLDLKRFAAELHEALRVALARQNKPVRAELRVELPPVHHELALMRQSAPRGRSLRRGDYSIPRFVVDLTKFIQSDLNTDSEHPFRLEAAVIENARNPKKSIFFPRDRTRGYGEGTYYQAITYA
ncbi:MAG: hypothetical protein WD066_20305 [Planctomycetaceae bacterium]